jgi:hypothetical protein
MKISGDSGRFFRIKSKVWNFSNRFYKINVLAIEVKIQLCDI